MTDQVNEAVAWQVRDADGDWMMASPFAIDRYQAEGREVRALYTHPSRGVVDEAIDLDDRLRAAYVKAHDAEEAWLEASGHLFDPHLPIDAGIRAVLREVQGHNQSRGVVDEDAVSRAMHAYMDEEIRIFGEVRTPNNGARREAMRAALQAAALPAVPEGMVLVPVEPTDGMISAGCDATNSYRVDMLRAWDAMLKSRPPHDQPEGSDNE